MCTNKFSNFVPSVVPKTVNNEHSRKEKMLIPLSINNFEFDQDGDRHLDRLGFEFTKVFLIDRHEKGESLWIRFGDGKPKYYYWSCEREIKEDGHFADPSQFWADSEKDYSRHEKHYRSTYGTDNFQDFLRNCCDQEDFTLEQLITEFSNTLQLSL
jgi:hypothetical protein